MPLTPLQKCTISLFHLLLTQLNFVWKQWPIIMTDFSCTASWDPNLLCWKLHTFTWTSCYCLPCCTDFFHINRCAMFMLLCWFITHISCYLKLLNNPAVSVSQWCNRNRKLLIILPLHSNIRTTIRVKGFDNIHFLIHHIWCHLVTQFSVVNDDKQISQVEWHVKVLYNCIQ
jgi:hypothetical protein